MLATPRNAGWDNERVHGRPAPPPSAARKPALTRREAGKAHRVLRHDRPVVDTDAAAHLYGKSRRTFFRALDKPGAPTPVNQRLDEHGKPVRPRPALYDRDQIIAWAAGLPLPPMPTDPASHPHDLLNRFEFAQLLGIEQGTFDRYETENRLPDPKPVYGAPHWTRETAEHYRDNRPGARAGAGRRPSSPDRSAHYPEVRRLIEEHGANVPASTIARHLGISERTAGLIKRDLANDAKD